MLVREIDAPRNPIARVTQIGETYGAKAAGLALLPGRWTLPLIALSSDDVERISSGDSSLLIQHWRELRSLHAGAGLIVRSSILNETIWERGTYLSVEAENASPESVGSAIVRVHADARAKGAVGLGIVLQRLSQRVQQGHFSNLTRLSRTRNQWVYSWVDRGSIGERGVNVWRDLPPDENEPLRPEAYPSRDRFFASLGRWLTARIGEATGRRVLVEWLEAPSGTIYVLQLDTETEDRTGTDPTSLRVEPSVPRADTTFHIVERAHQKLIAIWDKLKVLDDFAPAYDSITPALFLLRLDSFADISDGHTMSALLDDLRVIGANGLMARVSAKAAAAKEFHLPRSEGCDPQSLVDFMTWTCERFREEGRRLADYAFVIHRFIDAEASAWAKYLPDNPSIEIHANWGIADALNFYPFDTWDVYPLLPDVIEYPNFKSHFLWRSPTGDFKLYRTKNEVARHQCISRKDILDIASKTRSIGEHLGEPTQVMWFVGARTAEGNSVNIPWYRVPARRESFADAPSSARRIVVKARSDLDGQAVERGLPYVIELSPIEDSIRGKTLLDAVAEFSRRHDIPVLYLGSPMSHAFFQLQDAGCRIAIRGERQRLRRRNIQRFNKLVRDRIPEKISGREETPTYRRLSRQEAIQTLVGKLIEESQEALSAPADTLTGELADLFEVWRGLVLKFNLSIEDVLKSADQKRQKSGAFDSAFFLQETSLQPGSEERKRIAASKQLDEIIADRESGWVSIPFSYFGNVSGQSRRLVFFDDGESGLEIRLTPSSIDVRLVVGGGQLSFDFDDR